jgi:FkbM family methyltransferase
MNPLKAFTTPSYLFRPRQILVRLSRAFHKAAKEREIVKLPWGTHMLVRLDEAVGSKIWYSGVVELLVAEAISRLLDRSEVALDIGANIGQMTSLMRMLAGPGGRVLSFEPHPQLFAELEENIKLFTHPRQAPVETYGVAVSDSEGEGVLDQGAEWDSNRGLARLVWSDTGPGAGAFKVRMRRLDDILQSDVRVGVCKIDVEEQEIHVLRGAEGLLARHQIRDIIFEDFGTYPSEVQQTLRRHGYTLFSLHLTLFKPELRPLTAPPKFRRQIEGCDFLATLNPERARERFKSFGWMALKDRS